MAISVHGPPRYSSYPHNECEPDGRAWNNGPVDSPIRPYALDRTLSHSVWIFNFGSGAHLCFFEIMNDCVFLLGDWSETGND